MKSKQRSSQKLVVIPNTDYEERLLEKRAEIELVQPVFDESFYREQSGIKDGDLDALIFHFLETGWKAGLDPSRDFSTDFYLETYSDIRENGSQPLVHFLIWGSDENRAPRSCNDAEYESLKLLVDPKFYRYRYQNSDRIFSDSVAHFATFGWREGLDPNPYTFSRFIKKTSPEVFSTASTLAEHLVKPIFLNPLLKKPITYLEIREAVLYENEKLENIFNFQIEAYCSAQADVHAVEFFSHPVEHLFYDGLFQNRLSRENHINSLLTKAVQLDSDYEFLVNQPAPLKWTDFKSLDLTSTKQEVSLDISDLSIGLGIVLYDNTYNEINRLVQSIAANACGAEYSMRLHIWDNSPVSLDLDWISEICEGFPLVVSEHTENPGFALGHNGLMAECFDAGCTHYLGLNPDGFLLPRSLETGLRFAKSKSESCLIELDCEPISHPKWYHPKTGETEWVSGAAFMLDREAYVLTGGFDNEFPMYGEDVDLSFRAFNAGVKLYVAPKARFYHDTSGRIYKNEEWRSERMMIGSWYLCHKWGNPGRALAISTQLSQLKNRRYVLPKVPIRFNNIDPEITKLMEMDRFARSRFWK